MKDATGSLNLRLLNIVSALLAVLGVAFYWWVPTGIVLSIAGLAFGFIDWVNARQRSRNRRVSVVAMLLCIGALCLDVTIALLGLQSVTLGH